MGWFKRWRENRDRPRRIETESIREAVARPLREFLYLDEVSLRSLLSSQTGDLRDGASEQISAELQAEVAGALKVGNALTGAEGNLSSRFQTSNNSTIQTSRKATVQSWFKQFHEIEGLRLVEVTSGASPAADIDALISTSDKSLLLRSDELKRGELVEFRVRLSADPVYRLSTMVTEFGGMAEDYPDMFGSGGALETLREAQPIGKVLDRLLVGLVPIRAVAVDYAAILVDGVKHIVHKDLLANLSVPSEPVQIVGVTDQLGYWKDLRRVLFSEAEVTLLGRVSRSGVQSDWTPVKLAELFEETVPGVVAQINAAGRAGTQLAAPRSAVQSDDSRLVRALREYADGILSHKGRELTDDERDDLNGRIEELGVRSSSVSDQHSAFAALRSFVAELSAATVGPRRELALREQARASSGLPLFPSLENNSNAQVPASAPSVTSLNENIVDLEVVAIYW